MDRALIATYAAWLKTEIERLRSNPHIEQALKEDMQVFNGLYELQRLMENASKIPTNN